MYAGIEAGGTKWVCALGTGPGNILATERFPTTTPAETLSRAIAFFQRHAGIKALGISSFGPIDLRPDSPTYGYITTTPKAHWANTDIVGPLKRALGVPVSFDTDVNAAALGEHKWGAGQGLDTFVYLTIGTGIGGGALVHGQLLHGLLHPEMGHILIPHDRQRDPFAGVCRWHGDCWEGLASGPAIEKRWGAGGENLPADHPAWALEAHYLAAGLVNIISLLSPQRIILGGGVMHQPQLLALIRAEVKRLLNDYLRVSLITTHIEDYIVPPMLKDQAGVLGALALAEAVAETKR